MILVSECLCGVNCKYSGGNNENEKILKLVKEGRAVLVCPEQLGGLSTPRNPSEINGGTAEDVLRGRAKVLSNKGSDVTMNYIKGANETLKIAKIFGCREAILKSNSPSCGCGTVYDGSFTGKLVKGSGVTAQLLLDNGISVKTEKDIL